MKIFQIKYKTTILIVFGAILVFMIGFWFGNLGQSNHNSSTTEISHTHEDGSEPEFWTCSMHPQIKLPEPGQCPICFMDLIPLETTSSDEGPGELVLSQAAVELANVEVTAVTRQTAKAEIFLSGIVEYDESRLGKIAAWVPGRLERLFVDFTGIEVQKGDHMVQLYSPELIAAQEELIQALNQFESTNSDKGTLYTSVRSNLEAAREKLRLMGLSPRQITNIENGSDRSNILTIESPLSGIVIHKNAVEGMYVKTGSPIYTIADLSRVWVTLDVYESDIFWLKYGQDVSFTVEAVPGEVFHSRVAFIDPVLDPKTRTVKVRLNVDNTTKLLKPGMFVRATVHSVLDASGHAVNSDLAGKWVCPMHPEIVKNHPADCDICGMDLVTAESLGIVTAPVLSELPLLVPASAVLLTGKRAIVYIRIPGAEKPTFEGREVTLGARAGEMYIVTSGLVEGEEVVTKGNFKIDSALQIAAKPSMMNPGGGRTSTGHEGHNMTGMMETGTAIEMPGKEIQLDISSELANKILNPYLKLQALLAGDDYENAYKSLMDIHRLTMGVPGAEAVMEPTMRPIRNIDQLRTAFKDLSTALQTAAERNLFNGTINQAFCPMAFGNKGAIWLQKGKEIKNPYFGSRMLKCGEIQKTYGEK